MREVTEVSANLFALNDEDQRQLPPSGQQSVFANRVGLAKPHLRSAKS